MIDQLEQAAAELARGVLHPDDEPIYDGWLKECATRVLGILDGSIVPAGPTVEQQAAAAKLTELQDERADLTVTAKIDGTEPDKNALAELDRKIGIAEGLAKGEQ